MARHRKRGTSAASNNRIKAKKGASAQQAQILALNQKVNLNTRKLQGVRYKVQHTFRGGGIISATPTLPYTSYALNNVSQLGQIFSAPDESAGGKYNYDRAGRFFLQYNITSNTELSPMNLTIFIIRPKNSKVALSAGLNVPYVPGAPAITLLNNTDFVNSLGLAMMNKKRWHIDAHWAVNTSPIVTSINQPGSPAPAPTQNWQGDLHPIRKHYRGKNHLVLNNRTGVWSDTQNHAVNPSQRQYLVIFNNNLNTQASPNIAFQCLWTAFTSE